MVDPLLGPGAVAKTSRRVEVSPRFTSILIAVPLALATTKAPGAALWNEVVLCAASSEENKHTTAADKNGFIMVILSEQNGTRSKINIGRLSRRMKRSI